jgi:hypothetical protein
MEETLKQILSELKEFKQDVDKKFSNLEEGQARIENKVNTIDKRLVRVEEDIPKLLQEITIHIDKRFDTLERKLEISIVDLVPEKT